MNSCSYESVFIKTHAYHNGILQLTERKITMKRDIKKEHAESCEQCHHHEDIVKQVEANIPCEEDMYDLAELFKVFFVGFILKLNTNILNSFLEQKGIRSLGMSPFFHL